MSESMLIRVFYRPIFSAVFALIIAVVEALTSSVTLNPLTVPVLNFARSVADITSALFLAYAALDTCLRLWKLRRWEIGKGEFCAHCGGLSEVDWSRTRPQMRCLFCNRRQYV